MRLTLNTIIGSEEQFPLEHRLLNMLLALGIVLSFISAAIDYLIGRIDEVVICGVVIGVVLSGYYYLSFAMKQYQLGTALAVTSCIFIFTPVIWIFHGGLQSGGTFYILFFSSAIALLLSGFKRVAAISSLIGVVLLLVIVNYYYPYLIWGYSSEFNKYVDIACSLIIILITNAVGFALFMKFYLREQQKAKEFLLQIEQQKMDSALSRLDRLNLIGEMAASIGHEIRNPLTTVRGYLQFFQKKEMYHQHQKQFETMIEELDRANDIITEFLSLAKNKVVEFELCNLNDIVNVLLPLLQADALHTNHEIVAELGEIPNIKLDKKEMRQLILNLTKNGLEATPLEGKVTIKTELANGQVVFSVQDSGYGIPQDIRGKLGVPFVTTKEKGTGLGLPVCYRIVERHNATMEFETGPTGTIFYVRFNSVQ